jgi:catechol 2,3-dioxygenase-like lactoylglutathione lyase family enzyme
MFSHTMLGLCDLQRAVDFYAPVLAELGLRLYINDADEKWAAWQPAGAQRPLFIIGVPYNKGSPHPGNGTMVALAAPSRDQVDRAYALAMAAGGQDEGRPGLRAHYHADYYGAYFRDLDGNKICVVCHDPV